MIGESIEGCLDLLLIGDLAAIGAERFKQGATEGIAGEEPVQIASGNAAIPANAAIGAIGEAEHRPLKARSGRATNMHLVPVDRHTGRKLDPGGFDESLCVAENGVDLEQPKPLDGFLSALDAEAIGDGSPQHLIAAAEAEDMPGLAPMR